MYKQMHLLCKTLNWMWHFFLCLPLILDITIHEIQLLAVFLFIFTYLACLSLIWASFQNYSDSKLFGFFFFHSNNHVIKGGRQYKHKKTVPPISYWKSLVEKRMEINYWISSVAVSNRHQYHFVITFYLKHSFPFCLLRSWSLVLSGPSAMLQQASKK